MAGSWKTFSVPNSSTGQFNADIMILLTDGSVLVHNGFVNSITNARQWLRLTPDHNGRYETGTWSGELKMSIARQWFASGVLRDGRVYCIGGEHTDDPNHGSDTPTGEIFDPATNQWSALTKPAGFDFICGDCNGSGLADGRVMFGSPNSGSKRTAVWDPAANTWTETGTKFGALPSTGKQDPCDEESWALLPDGSVFVPAVANTPKAQRYLPATDQWVDCKDAPVSLAITKLKGVEVDEIGGLIVLPGGQAFVVGGTGNTATFTPGPNATDQGTWTTGPTFPKDTSASPNWPTLTALDAPACLLPSGKVVFLAGTTAPDGGYFSQNPVALEYNPAASPMPATMPKLDAQPALPAANYTWQSAFLLLPTGQMLCSGQTNTLLLYTPDASEQPQAAWRPNGVSIPATMVPGRSYNLSGKQINGLSQAVCYGDDGGMATNYPIVKLTNSATGQVRYARTSNFSTMGIATGSATQTCTVQIPGGLALGPWHLQVIANGIASDVVNVQLVPDCSGLIENIEKLAQAVQRGLRLTVQQWAEVEQELNTCLKAHKITQAQYNMSMQLIAEMRQPREVFPVKKP